MNGLAIARMIWFSPIFATLDTLKIILTFARSFEIQYRVSILEASNGNIFEGLQASNLLQGASEMWCLRHFGIAKFLLCCSSAFWYIEEEVPDIFGVTHVQDGLLLTASFEDAVLLLVGARRYVANPNMLKGGLTARAFNKEALQCARLLHVLYSSIMDSNADKIGSGVFGDFLAVDVPHTKTTLTTALDIFSDDMKLIQDDVCEKIKSVK